MCQFGFVQASFVPSREFWELCQMCRFRRKLVQDGARQRQRMHKIIDLGHHVSSKIERLALTLEAELEADSIWRLRGLLDGHDAINQRVKELDERVERA